MADLVVAGAGMGGLVAAARARELGASVVVYEKGERAGGSAALSSGVVWRYPDLARYREECPGGDERLQALILERFDDALAWLESLGAPVIEQGTGNPLTLGVRFDAPAMCRALARRAGDLRLGEPLRELPQAVPVVLATGGFHASPKLVERYVTPEARHLLVRGNASSAGDGLRLGLVAGARLSDGLDEFYGRAMPDMPGPLQPGTFIGLAQLYARFAQVEDERGERYEREPHWSEIDVVQWLARRPRARGLYLVPDSALGERVRDRTVREMVEAARAAGAAVERRDGVTVVPVRAGITQTLGGLAVEPSARAADGVWACGADVGGVATRGYASGLAAALVLGLTAAESALGRPAG